MLVISNQTNKIPIFINLFFLTIQLLYGIDFGFTSIVKRKWRCSTKIFTVTMSTVWIILLVYVTIRRSNDSWRWFNIIKYVAFICVLNKLKYTVHHLLNDIDGINPMSITQKIYLCAIPIVYWIVLNSIKICLLAVRCTYERGEKYCTKFDNIVLYSLYCSVVVGLDSIGVAQIIIYYYIQCCIKNISKTFLKTKLKLKYFERHYWAIAKCYDSIRPLYDFMIILELGIVVPKMMASIWSVMYYLNTKAYWYSYMTEIVFVFHLATQICTPAIVAEMVNSQVDSIKLLLKEKLLEERDERMLANIKHTLVLLEIKPLNHLVLRFIPIDLKLLLAVFSVCSTYFIVIIQFSHMYD